MAPRSRLTVICAVDFQFSARHRKLPQMLHLAHDVGLLVDECNAEIVGPAGLIVQLLDELRERQQELDAGVPGERPNGVEQGVILQRSVVALMQPFGGIGDILRVG